MAKKGKRYAEAFAKVDRSVYYDASQALGLVVDTASAKFDETVEAHIKLVLTLDMLTSRLEELSCYHTVQVRQREY